MPALLDRCIEKVKASSKKKVNAYAVCRAQLGTDSEIRKRMDAAKKGKK